MPIHDISPSLLALLIVLASIIINMHRNEQARLRFNEQDWKIANPAKQSLFVRFINIFNSGLVIEPILLFTCFNALVKPVLSTSLQAMILAEQRGTVDPILCNLKARQDMVHRMDVLYLDMCQSKDVTLFGKIMMLVNSFILLGYHQQFLTLGMSKEVANESVSEPVFIMSLPRTGTTILHRALAKDIKKFRCFDYSDLKSPFDKNGKPVPRWDVKGRKAKAEEVDHSLVGKLNLLYPGFFKCMETMHAWRSEDADEDWLLYSMGLGVPWLEYNIKFSYLSRSKPAGRNVTVEGMDAFQYNFAWLHMVMKIFQVNDKVEWERRRIDDIANSAATSDNPSLFTSTHKQQHSFYRGPCPTDNLPWLIKDPPHSEYGTILLNEFPDAKVIFLHRPLDQVVASISKLRLVMTAVDMIPGTEGSSSQNYGNDCSLIIKERCRGMLEFTKGQDPTGPLAVQHVSHRLIEKSSSTRRIDLNFREYVKDVPAAIRNVYKQFYPNESGPSKEAMDTISKYLESMKREKLGKQDYCLEDFHIATEDFHSPEYDRMFLNEKGVLLV
jgi:hypothetical protein